MQEKDPLCCGMMTDPLKVLGIARDCRSKELLRKIAYFQEAISSYRQGNMTKENICMLCQVIFMRHNEFYLQFPRPKRIWKAERAFFSALEEYHHALLGTEEDEAYRRKVREAEMRADEAHQSLLRLAYEWREEAGLQAYLYYSDMLMAFPDKEYKKGRVRSGKIRKTPEEINSEAIKMAFRELEKRSENPTAIPLAPNISVPAGKSY